MCKLLSVIMLLTAWFRLSAAVTALGGMDDGGRNLADLAVAELSGQFEFVDRRTIDAIRREAELQRMFPGATLARKLRLAGAELFAAIDTLPSGERRLTVFESSCGFRLKQRLLSASDEEAIREIGEALSIAAARNGAPDSVRFVSIAGVRNNLHYSLNSKALPLADALSQKTAGLEMAVLERDYLIELLRERSLSGKWEKVVTASEILHFELNPGETPERFTIAVYFTDPAGKISFHQEVASSDPDGVSRLFSAVAEYLATPGKVSRFDRRSEAARFFREAELENRDSLARLRKQFAAFALDDGTPAYLIGIRSGELNETYPWLAAVLRHLAEKPELLDNQNSYSRVLNILYALWRDRDQLTTEERREHEGFLDRHRDLFLNVCLPEERNNQTLRALNRLKNEQECLYPDRTRYAAALAADWDAVLRSLAASSPEERKKLKWKQIAKIDVYQAAEELFSLQAILSPAEAAKWNAGMVRRLEETGIPELKPLAVLLEADLLLCLGGEGAAERAVAAFERYFQVVRETDDGQPKFYIWYRHETAARYPGLPERLQNMAATYRTPPPKTRSASRWRAATQWPAGEESGPVFASAVSGEGELFFLTDGDFDIRVMRLAADGVATQIATFPHEPNHRAGYVPGWRLWVGGDRIVVANRSAVYAGQLGASGPLWKIGSIPFDLNAIWEHAGRIFILGDSTLASFDFHGGDRRTHFSASQEGKSLAIQREFPKIKTVCGWPGADADVITLLFVLGPGGEIRRFRLSDVSSETVCRLPVRMDDFSKISASGGRFFWPAGTFANDADIRLIRRYDTAANVLSENGDIPELKQFRLSAVHPSPTGEFLIAVESDRIVRWERQ